MLSIVVTPIGNLADMSYRAVEVLKSVDLILCEDTRHSAVLLSYYGISTPTRKYEKYSENKKLDDIVEMLKSGKDLALISDAGTPVISDPGNLLVKRLQEEGLKYTLVGSGCAAISAMVLSGFDARDFCFVGFLPERDIDRKRRLEKFKNVETTTIFYVAPHDIERDIASIYEIYGERRACLVREISKVYEDIIRFNLPTLPEGSVLKGEMVLLVEGAVSQGEVLKEKTLAEHMEFYTAQGLSEKDAMKAVAKDRGVSKSEIYGELKRG